MCELARKGTAALAAVLVLAGCASGARTEGARLAEGALLASACSGCHANDGRPEAIPSLAGRSAFSIAAMLRSYQEEGGSSMHRMARGYSDDEIRLIAAYLAGEGR